MKKSGWMALGGFLLALASKVSVEKFFHKEVKRLLGELTRALMECSNPSELVVVSRDKVIKK